MAPLASLRSLLALGSFVLIVRAFGTNDSLDSTVLAVSPLQDPFPFQFPELQDANSSSLFPMEKCKGVSLEEATIDELQHAMNSGKLSSEELVFCFMRRMQQVDQYVSSVLEFNPDVFSIAAALDEERKAGKVRGPLHGIPFLVKDNIASKDKMETTAGSWVLLGSVVPRDAFVVAQLRKAGAVLFGKATLSEWADMRSNNYSEGFSARGGQSRSPYNLTVTPGGSSSGSAIAVAANVVPFALGTETDGSVINPAERNGVVGIKPTVGLTSRNGVIPESEHQDTVGTFGKTVRDATYALDAIYGIDSRDNYTSAQFGQTPPRGYAQFLSNRTALSNATFGIPWASFWQYASSSQQATLVSILKYLETQGATIVNNTELPSRSLVVSPDGWDWDYGTTRGFANESEYTVVAVDFYRNIATYLSELSNTPIRSLADIVEYNRANDGTEGGYPWPLGIPAFYSGQDGFLASLATNGTRDETYWQALAFCQTQTRERGIDAALKGVDALLVPPDVGQTYQVAAQAGYPMITVPAGVDDADSGMPFGLALMGTAWSEAGLVRWASAIEDAIRVAPARETKRWGRTLPKWLGYLEKNIPV
ncbi:glutamyl-tRNA amidotransferase subunit A [Phyllosticta capitalensis]|uniref:Glutamyl-tRNA amidotransferase subunit A n=1 Tax=Phyllosticta capitalensis TaxID=121624 RepID=A0ABR1YM55_9PEZI